MDCLENILTLFRNYQQLFLENNNTEVLFAEESGNGQLDGKMFISRKPWWMEWLEPNTSTG